MRCISVRLAASAARFSNASASVAEPGQPAGAAAVVVNISNAVCKNGSIAVFSLRHRRVFSGGFSPPDQSRTMSGLPRPATSALCPRDIFGDILCEHVERDVAALDDDVVEIAQVIFRADRLLRQPALADDFAVPDLVSARLAGPAAIAIDLAGDLERVGAILLDEKRDTLLARPALGVKAGVDDKPAGAKCERLKIAEAPDLEI